MLLFFTQAPFYIDKNGIPRRAGSSIIKNALQDAVDTTVDPTPSNPTTTSNHNNKRKDSTVSEADRMRYRAAVRKLKTEYGEWNKQALLEARRQEEEQEMQQQQLNQQRNSATPGRSSSSPASPQSPGAGEVSVRQSSFTTPPSTTTTNTPTRRSFLNVDGNSATIMGSPVGPDEIADRRVRSRAETLRKSSIEFVFPGRTRFSVDEPESDNNATNNAATGNTSRGPLFEEDDQEEDDEEEQKRDAREKIRNQNSSRNESLRLILGIESYKKGGP